MDTNGYGFNRREFNALALSPPSDGAERGFILCDDDPG